MNILAIDYGEKFVGLALGPSGTRLAVPFGTIARTDDAQLVESLLGIISKEKIGSVLVGMPFTLKDTESAQTRRTKVFVALLHERIAAHAQATSTSCEVQTFPEALTSREAGDRPHGKGASIHERSAMIILEDWLEMHH